MKFEIAATTTLNLVNYLWNGLSNQVKIIHAIEMVIMDFLNVEQVLNLRQKKITKTIRTKSRLKFLFVVKATTLRQQI